MFVEYITFALEKLKRAPACSRRSLFFKREDASHVVTRIRHSHVAAGKQ